MTWELGTTIGPGWREVGMYLGKSILAYSKLLYQVRNNVDWGYNVWDMSIKCPIYSYWDKWEGAL